MYGPRVIGSLSPVGPVVKEYNASGSFAQNDFVKFDGASGEIDVATAGASILGVCTDYGTSGAFTAASTNVAVDVRPLMVVLMDNDNDTETFASTHIGEWGDFTGGTGAMLVDSNTLSTTKAQLFVLEYNPQGYGLDDDTSIGKFLVAETYFAEQAAA